MYRKLEDMFSDSPDQKVLEDFFKLFQDFKTACRNEFGPPYDKARCEEHSGEYDDSEVVLSIVRDSIRKRIDANMYKTVQSDLVDWKTKSATPPSRDALRVMEKRTAFYEAKKANWSSNALPRGYLAFLFCAKPGLGFNSLTVIPVTPQDNGLSKNGRDAIRTLKKRKQDSTTSSGGGLVSLEDRNESVALFQERALELKEREILAKETKNKIKLLQAKIKLLQETLKEQREFGLENTPQYRQIVEDYMQAKANVNLMLDEIITK